VKVIYIEESQIKHLKLLQWEVNMSFTRAFLLIVIMVSLSMIIGLIVIICKLRYKLEFSI
jgi:hypothetical protein